MLERWVTCRFLAEDMPPLAGDHRGVTKFLGGVGATSSGTEPLATAQRADTFTYHFGTGRGVRWHDKTRQVLWLVSFGSAHDAEYDRAADLQAQGRLYPALDPQCVPGTGTRAKWGVFVDEDGLEWARFIHDSLEFFASLRLRAGDSARFDKACHLTLYREDEDIWKLTIRRRLAYTPDCERGRWLTPAELHCLFDHLVEPADQDLCVWDVPPHPQSFLFADVCFVGRLRTPQEWHARIVEQAARRADLGLLLPAC